jgi:beta-fructofuranosidase
MSREIRVRPEYHFTVKNGWTNDPHGIVFYKEKYHMFFQYCPKSITHQFEVSWGRATSDDLIIWHEEPLAIAPTIEEIGCWSGSAVVDGEKLILIYTQIPKIPDHDYNQAFISSATTYGDLQVWERRTLKNALIAGPPPDLDLVAFRDPYVWRDGSGWKTVIGAGVRDYGGAMLQYSSADLEEWRYDGIAAKRSSEDHEGAWTARIWECPQLVNIEGSWALFISVCDDPPNKEESHLQYIAYTIGEYDGREFIPGEWNQYSYGKTIYATTAFKENDGSQNLLSWMRETNNGAPKGSPWASAMSLPLRISIEDGSLVTRFHPNLDSVITTMIEVPESKLAQLPGAFRLQLWICPDHEISERTISLDSGTEIVRLAIDSNSFEISINELLAVRIESKRVLGTGSSIDLVIDNETLESLWNKNPGIAALRLAPSNQWTANFESITMDCCSVSVTT